MDDRASGRLSCHSLSTAAPACSSPGKCDSKLGEFWVDNPFDIIREGHNLSCFERNRLFMNRNGREFLDVSFVSATDTDGDGRAAVAADFRGNGRLDLVVRQSGGGPMLIYENNFPQRHYLEVSLRGDKSNRLGIGARLKALAGGQQIVRELYPHNTYRSQMPSQVHFGLGDAKRVERLTITWPSGKVQELTNIPADQHILIDESREGAQAIEVVIPGRTIAP